MGSDEGALRLRAYDAGTRSRLYATRERFSVRTSGLPNVGIEGVCFGRVVAAMTPEERAVQLGERGVGTRARARVRHPALEEPRCRAGLLEGLSEYETIARRPEWQAGARSGSLRRAHREPPPRRRGHEPRLHARHRRGGHDGRLLRGEPDARLHRRAVRHAKGGGRAEALGPRGEDAGGDPAGVTACPQLDYDARYRAWEMQKLAAVQGASCVFRDRIARGSRPAATARSDTRQLRATRAHAELAISLLHARKARGGCRRRSTPRSSSTPRT